LRQIEVLDLRSLLMAFPPPRLAGAGVGEADRDSGDSMQWTSWQDFDFNGSNVSPQDFNFDQKASEFSFQQHALLFNGHSSPIPSQDPITQTAPPFRTRQSHVSDHRPYHTDSRVPSRQLNGSNGFLSDIEARATAANTADPHYLVSRSSNVYLWLH